MVIAAVKTLLDEITTVSRPAYPRWLIEVVPREDGVGAAQLGATLRRWQAAAAHRPRCPSGCHLQGVGGEGGGGAGWGAARVGMETNRIRMESYSDSTVYHIFT
jgi:hypothetical protein